MSLFSSLNMCKMRNLPGATLLLSLCFIQILADAEPELRTEDLCIQARSTFEYLVEFENQAMKNSFTTKYIGTKTDYHVRSDNDRSLATLTNWDFSDNSPQIIRSIFRGNQVPPLMLSSVLGFKPKDIIDPYGKYLELILCPESVISAS